MWTKHNRSLNSPAHIQQQAIAKSTRALKFSIVSSYSSSLLLLPSPIMLRYWNISINLICLCSVACEFDSNSFTFFVLLKPQHFKIHLRQKRVSAAPHPPILFSSVFFPKSSSIIQLNNFKIPFSSIPSSSSWCFCFVILWKFRCDFHSNNMRLFWSERDERNLICLSLRWFIKVHKTEKTRKRKRI